ncbi:MAG: YHS domain-containing protein [Desulfobacterota bacterium]|nr:YHS domain-containing protein [Thermodesulfobacteriota bacterium]
MIKILLFCVLVYLFVQLINRLFFPRVHRIKTIHGNFSRSGAAPPIQDMVQDPVCRVYVQKKDALSVQHNGTIYYFCCEECRQKFTDTIGR